MVLRGYYWLYSQRSFLAELRVFYGMPGIKFRLITYKANASPHCVIALAPAVVLSLPKMQLFSVYLVCGVERERREER